MIAESGQALVEVLQREMVPDQIMSKDLIALRIPQLQDQDYVIGAFLYHIDEDHEAGQQGYRNESAHERSYPGRALSLSYVLFVNEEATFGGFHKEQEDRLLERMIQIFHDCQELQVMDQTCRIHFDSLNLDSRIRLWQSFSKPLQPAIYLQIHPVLVASLKKETIHRVKQTTIKSERKQTI